MQKISTGLWFDDNAEEAVLFYLSVFKNGKITATSYYGPEGPGPEGSVLTIQFEIEGREFEAINGGPHFSFTPAISLIVNCETQEEVDWYWEKLSEGGSKDMCGWLTDKFGLSWQIVPTELGRLMQAGDREKVSRMMKAMLRMHKLDIQALKLAFEGK
jgi:predicted 3-demethylubiquinone-9 3-methyltransferase (glyoxalase superfamily)